jgi:hypothetical protein
MGSLPLFDSKDREGLKLIYHSPKTFCHLCMLRRDHYGFRNQDKSIGHQTRA